MEGVSAFVFRKAPGRTGVHLLNSAQWEQADRMSPESWCLSGGRGTRGGPAGRLKLQQMCGQVKTPEAPPLKYIELYFGY